MDPDEPNAGCSQGECEPARLGRQGRELGEATRWLHLQRFRINLIIFLDPDQIALAMGTASVRTSDEASVDMSDTSSMASAPTVAAAQHTSLFQTNSAAIIASLTANWRVVRAGAVQIFDAQSLTWA